MKNNIVFLIVLLCLFSSCGDFLEEYSQDLTYAKTAADLDEILIGDGYMQVPDVGAEIVGLENSEGPYFPWIHVMDDDITEYAEGSNAEGTVMTELRNFYSWGAYPCMIENEEKKDVAWKRLYKHISAINVILSKTGEIHDFPEEIERIKGECHFLRAVYYFYLVNFYAKPYSKVSATTDLGVPLKTREYVEDIYFQRNTLEETYTQILNDLRMAASLLKGKKHKTIYRAGYYAVHAMLSRVYLYMEDYEHVLQSADTVLQGRYALLDYNERVALVKSDEGGTIQKGVSVVYKDSPETIFSQGGNCFVSGNYNAGFTNVYNYTVSENLKEMYNREPGTDLRIGAWLGIYDINEYGIVTKVQKLVDKEDGLVSSECLIRLPEILLNKAEALAMLSRDAEAQQLIEELRQRRIKSDNYVPLSVRTGKELIELIRDERRRELCFEGHRWFDLRRYAVNSKYPYSKPIIHDCSYFNNNVWSREYQGSYRLEKYETEAAYVMPIPRSVIEFNKGNMVDNATRPEREMFKRF